MQPDAAAYLWDARTAAVLVQDFIEGLSEATYRSDELHKSAVERQFEIVGEALNNLRKADPETAARIPDLPRIIGMRNILAHAYAVIDDAVVWDAATARIPALIDAIDRLLTELG